MAESIAAFGLAASILQFVDFGSRVASNFRRFHQAHQLDREDAPDLQKINSDLQHLLEELQMPEENSQESGLVQLAKECQDVANELDEKLTSIFKTSRETSGKRDALKSSFKLAWKENELRSLQERVDHFRNQLVIHLLASLRSIIPTHSISLKSDLETGNKATRASSSNNRS
jgi:hypothetical protein